MKRNNVIAVAAVAALALPVLSAPQALAAPALADRLVGEVSVEGINRHLIAFQRIADRTGGTRADPTPGFQQSADYVVNTMKANGFAVRVQEFTYNRKVIDAAAVTAGQRRYTPTQLDNSMDTPVGGITAPLAVVPADATSGCEAADYAGLNIRGAVALIKRGGCTFTQKQLAAAEAGAVAVVVYNYATSSALGYIDPAQSKIPIVMVGEAAGAALSTMSGQPTTVEVRRHIEPTVSRNISAQTRTGRTDNVIALGAHLDSFRAGPGINENASSVSTLLELALKLGSSPQLNNAVRFNWFGADSENTGSGAYLRSLSFEEQLDIALYLDVQAIGSSNGGHFVFDGDNSDGLTGPMPYGSDKIEKLYTDYFAGRGIATEGTNVAGFGQGDYSNFIGVGIPTGGPYSGIQALKTPAQVAKWGGTAGIPLDPCHDDACDNLGNINRPILDRNADAVAFVTGTYATSTEDVNGVPSRAQRKAARAASRLAAATTPGGST